MRLEGLVGLAAAAILSSGCAVHPHGGRGYERRHAWDVGYERGYHDGARHGRVDGHRYRRYEYRDAWEYRNPGAHYRGSYRGRRQYADGYRDGYEDGYRRAFDAERRVHRRRGHECRAGRDRYGRRRD